MLARYSSEIKTSLMLAYPVMLSQLGHVLMGFTDNVMVGHLNATSLAAAGLANVAFNVLLLFGIGVSYAITPLVAAADGSKDLQSISDVLKHGLVINVVNAMVLIVLVSLAQHLLYHIGQPEEVIQLSIPYLNIITWSLLPTLIFQTFRQFAEGLSYTLVPMVAVLAANVLNIFLNYVLIYGHFGVEGMGLIGAGYATLLSRIFMALSLGLYVYLAPLFRNYRSGFMIRNYSLRLFKKMLGIGLPAGLQFIFEVAAFDFSLVMMGWLGTQSLAAHQIAINLATISYMTISGIAAAATIRVSYFYGKGDMPHMRHAVKVLMGLAIVFMGGCAALFILGRNWLPHMYVTDGEVLTLAGPLLVIAGIFQLSDGIQVVSIAALRGLRDVTVPSLFIFISYWVIGLPLGYVLAFVLDMGAISIWSGLCIGLTLTALATILRLRNFVRKLPAENSFLVN
jgi:multidrug resistance protein, MATE family